LLQVLCIKYHIEAVTESFRTILPDQKQV